jgi:hypothetical protein
MAWPPLAPKSNRAGPDAAMPRHSSPISSPRHSSPMDAGPDAAISRIKVATPLPLRFRHDGTFKILAVVWASLAVV